METELSLDEQIGALTVRNHELTRFSREQAEKLKEFAREHNRLRRQFNELVGQRNKLTGRVNELTRQKNQLTGRVNTLTGDKSKLSLRVRKLTELNKKVDINMEASPDEFSTPSGGATPSLKDTDKLNTAIELLTQRINSLTTANNALTKKNNELTGKVNELVGIRNSLTGSINDLTGRVNELTGKLNYITSKNNELTSINNKLTEARNYLTDDNNRLTSRINNLTASANMLTRTVNQLSGEVARLVEDADADSFEAEAALAGEDVVDSSPAAEAPHRVRIANPEALARPRSAKFLIVSNQRSGSTWLETILGALPDVGTDYEFKWNINYAPRPIHRVLSSSSPTVSEVLASLDIESPIAGSKLVFDRRPLSGRQFGQLFTAIGDDVKLIHLTRNYRDVFLSARRGMLHKMRDDGSLKVGKNLRDAIERQQDTLLSLSSEAYRVSPLEVYEELTNYLRNDMHFSRLASPASYLRVDYASIERVFPSVAAFIGSNAGPEVLARTLEASPTVKLPPIPAENIISNLDEIERVFDVFDELKERYLPANI